MILLGELYCADLEGGLVEGGLGDPDDRYGRLDRGGQEPGSHSRHQCLIIVFSVEKYT